MCDNFKDWVLMRIPLLIQTLFDATFTWVTWRAAASIGGRRAIAERKGLLRNAKC